MVEVGSKVQKYKVGDRVGVGCLVNSCRSCNSCDENLENYCSKSVLTYGAKDIDGSITQGGYSDLVVVDEHFVIGIPDNLPLEAAAPLLCAGITVYSPLIYFGIGKPDLHVGVVGLGGVGHMAVKFAKAFGAKVTVISTSPNKKKEAIERLGADSFLVSRNQDELEVLQLSLSEPFHSYYLKVFLFRICVVYFFCSGCKGHLGWYNRHSVCSSLSGPSD